MIILSIKTAGPEAELGLYNGDKQLASEKWQAHRELAETIHKKLREILNRSSKSLDELQGIVVYQGPGSFTGLRIGLSVANALAYSLDIPIVAAASGSWIEEGLRKIKAGKNDRTVMPEYGAPVRITAPRK